jgi:hypothetical protein
MPIRTVFSDGKFLVMTAHHRPTPALHDLPPIDGRTVFKSVGVAIQDWAIADALARLDDPAEESPARLETAR